MRSVSGTVDFSGRLATTGRYEFQSHSGDVRVAPVRAVGLLDRGIDVQPATCARIIR